MASKNIYTELSIHLGTQAVCRRRGHLLDPSRTSQSGPRSLRIPLEHTQRKVLRRGRNEVVRDALKTDKEVSLIAPMLIRAFNKNFKGMHLCMILNAYFTSLQLRSDQKLIIIIISQ